jgi:4-hydroxybenzoate polyprenyltransferase
MNEFILGLKEAFIPAILVVVVPTTALGFLTSGLGNASLFLVSILLIILVDLSANVINNYSDWEIDIENNKRKHMHKVFSKRDMLTIYVVLLILIFVVLALAQLNYYLLITVLIAILLGILYSSGPKFKDITIINYITIAIAYAATAFAIGYFAGSSSLSGFIRWLPLMLFLMFVDFGYSITKDYSDMLGDAAHGKKTLPVVKGKKTSIKIQLYEITFAYAFLFIAVAMNLLSIVFSLLIISYFVAIYILTKIKNTENKETYERMHYYAQRNGLLVRALIIIILLILGLL